MKLDISFQVITQESADIEIDDEEFNKWVTFRPYLETYPRDYVIQVYLNDVIGMKKVSDLVGWGQHILEVVDVDIIEEEKTNNE